jgi:hypothetical protein
MYTKAVAWASNATPLPMWVEMSSGMVPIPNMVADFRDIIRLRGAGRGRFKIVRAGVKRLLLKLVV